MNSIATQQAAPQPEATGPNYLAEHTIRSWLLTTDHKRIGLLYMISLTLFFLLGGAAATLMRLELATPQGDLVTSDTYNKLFTLHGVVMVWFFLIPSIPTVLGNFLVPMMIGARDVAFPRLNLASGISSSLAPGLPSTPSSREESIPVGPSIRRIRASMRMAMSSPWPPESSSQALAPSPPA